MIALGELGAALLVDATRVGPNLLESLDRRRARQNVLDLGVALTVLAFLPFSEIREAQPRHRPPAVPTAQRTGGDLAIRNAFFSKRME